MSEFEEQLRYLGKALLFTVVVTGLFFLVVSLFNGEPYFSHPIL